MSNFKVSESGPETKLILVVDDELGARLLLSIMLGRGNFTVLKAGDARAVLEILEEATPDLIILDVIMPGTDGIELCKRIRARPETAQIPMIILSALGDQESVDRRIAAGADGYLVKPVLKNNLLAIINSMLNQAG